MNTIKLNQNIGKAKAGSYKVTNTFSHEGFDTIFFSRILKNGTVSTSRANGIIMNSTLNPNAPSVGQLDKAIEKGLITVTA